MKTNTAAEMKYAIILTNFRAHLILQHYKDYLIFFTLENTFYTDWVAE